MEPMHELEMKIAFVEHHVHELDAIIRTLSDDMVRLRAEVAELRAGATSGDRGPNEMEKPPHY